MQSHHKLVFHYDKSSTRSSPNFKDTLSNGSGLTYYLLNRYLLFPFLNRFFFFLPHLSLILLILGITSYQPTFPAAPHPAPPKTPPTSISQPPKHPGHISLSSPHAPLLQRTITIGTNEYLLANHQSAPMSIAFHLHPTRTTTRL